MNPYQDPENRRVILEMQLAVNAASRAAWNAEKVGDRDAQALRQEWKDLNLELQQHIETLSRA